MEMLAIVLLSAVILTIAYFTYGRWLARMFQLNDTTPTPAVTLRDDIDYVPCQTGPLLSQHFSAIAAAGPIVGPILAGLYFGWLPALLWILIGSILIGGVHDFSALVASIRHKASSILEVVRIHISGRAYLLFLTFVWLALVYIVVAFTDVTASMFVGALDVENGTPFKSMAAANAAENTGTLVLSGGIATSSLIYLALPMIMGLLVRSGALSMAKATWIFLPLVGVAIWVGQYIPLNVDELFMRMNPSLTPDEAVLYAVRSWDVFLLLYCAIASVIPMWLLLQPRGQLGGYFLYAALGAGALGILLGGQPIEQPMFKGFVQEKGNLFPFLFITIACGACSGFHSLIASGTTSKQLKVESNAKPIGYGAMLLEAMVAIVSLWSGLEARHILCRWREPPECRKHSDTGLKGRHIRQCVGPPGLRFLRSQTGGSRHRQWICRPSGPERLSVESHPSPCPELHSPLKRRWKRLARRSQQLRVSAQSR
jgi:carbon starvation protein